MRAAKARAQAQAIAQHIDALVESVRITRHCREDQARRLVALWIVAERASSRLLTKSEWLESKK